MFEIDEELYAVLEKVGIDAAIDRRVIDFKKVYPKRFACACKENVRNFIEYARRKAEQYNMLAEREVSGLIILMYHLGCDFDLDPQYPWARFKRFPDKTYTEQMPESFVHLKKVGNTFLEFRQRIEGDDLAIKKAAGQRLAKTLLVDFYPFTEAAILEKIQRIYPERYACIPENVLSGPIMQAAQTKSFENDLNDRVGKVIFDLLIFMFGISVDTDPLYANLIHKLRTIDPGTISGHYTEQVFFTHLKSLVADELRDMENQEQS